MHSQMALSYTFKGRYESVHNYCTSMLNLQVFLALPFESETTFLNGLVANYKVYILYTTS